MQAVNIFLIGPMGAGKSSIGASISKILQCEFLDTDAILQDQLNLTVPQIFVQFGESYFRKIEAELIAKLTSLNNIVLATGGGSILQRTTRKILQKRGLVCYLQVDVDNQLRRISDLTSRPLLYHDPHATLIKLALERNCLYEEIADIIINTNAISSNVVITKLLDKIAMYQTKNTALCT